MRRLWRRERGMIRSVAVVPTLALGLVGSFHMAFEPRSPASVHEAVLVELRRAPSSAIDVRTLGLVQDAQQELDSWAGWAISRLRADRMDAALDARAAHDQIRRIRDEYAWSTRTPEFTRALLVLADAHQHRVAALHEMLRAGAVDERRYLVVETDVATLWAGIRDWAQPLRPTPKKPQTVSLPPRN